MDGEAEAELLVSANRRPSAGHPRFWLRVLAAPLLALLLLVAAARLQRSWSEASSQPDVPQQKWDLKQSVADVLHNAADAAVAFGVQGMPGGAPEAHIDTTRASGQHLVEELLSNKRLTKDIQLKPVEGGLIEQGRLYDIYLERAEVGASTHLEVDQQNGMVKFVVADLRIDVRSKYDLRLTSMAFGEEGNVKATLFGPKMTLIFLTSGTGSGGCSFSQGLDLQVEEAVSTKSEMNVAIKQVLDNNIMNVRVEIVRGMEDGLCRALLDDDEVSGVLGSAAEEEALAAIPMSKPTSMTPYLFGALTAELVLLACCFWLGRQSILMKDDCCEKSVSSCRATVLEPDKDSNSDAEPGLGSSTVSKEEIASSQLPLGTKSPTRDLQRAAVSSGVPARTKSLVNVMEPTPGGPAAGQMTFTMPITHPVGPAVIQTPRVVSRAQSR
eukprot:TRINITY_DN4393_c0_g1_i1.p1 TRINITY_DN4393_c0_g1~~TRINITY_DN4393_c0_g1_i1.p1  ORF type:complete len:440 (-),score=96.29 TRINITY_DN4393_c0_g1_i1:414-1733(-)